MITIRQNTFETNSSSTHSLCICSNKEYKEFMAGERLYNNSWVSSTSKFRAKNLVTIDELIDIYVHSTCSDTVKQNIVRYKGCKTVKECRKYDKKHKCDVTFDELTEDEFQPFENFGGDYYETFSEEYKTESGDEIVVFGFYGYSG